MGVHDGHRQRMKERFAEAGLDGFSDHNALEMLLFYALPRKDTNELAHKLIEHFGSLAAVLEADYEDIRKVDGIGDSAAVLLKLIPEISRRYMLSISAPKRRIDGVETAGQYFVSKFMYEVNELCYALLLDNDCSVIACRQISSGVVNATEVGLRKLVEEAMKYHAANVIIAHNHPHGMPMPSKEDEYCTGLVKNALEMMNVKLVDHIIVGSGNYCSLSAKGLM